MAVMEGWGGILGDSEVVPSSSPTALSKQRLIRGVRTHTYTEQAHVHSCDTRTAVKRTMVHECVDTLVLLARARCLPRLEAFAFLPQLQQG